MGSGTIGGRVLRLRASCKASSGRAALEPIVLVVALGVVVAQKGVLIALDFGGRDVPRLPTDDTEALFKQRATHAFDEAVRVGWGDLGGVAFDIFHLQRQLVRTLFGLAAELAAAVG